jgi:hypothetical protein
MIVAGENHGPVLYSYSMAYGESGNTVIPGYGMLIFYLRLQDFWR